MTPSDTGIWVITEFQCVDMSESPETNLRVGRLGHNYFIDGLEGRHRLVLFTRNDKSFSVLRTFLETTQQLDEYGITCL